MSGETDVRMENGESRPELRLTNERIRIVKNVEIQRIDIVRDQDDRVEEGNMLKNQIRRRAEILLLKNDDGHNARQHTEDRQRENNSSVDTSVALTEIPQNTRRGITHLQNDLKEEEDSHRVKKKWNRQRHIETCRLHINPLG